MLRIIAGEFKGRRLLTPAGGEKVRPLPDRVRTSVFNMLAGHFEGNVFFDAFAGSGSFGLEAISRGADRCVMVEQDREVGAILEENLVSIGADDRGEIVRSDALGISAHARCPQGVNVIFFDPPYPMMRDPGKRELVFRQFARCIERLDERGFALIRTPWPFADRPDEQGLGGGPVSLAVDGADGPETHTYGSTAVHWYMRSPGAPGDSSNEHG